MSDIKKPGQHGILSANFDQLANDPLAVDPLKTEYDPLGEAVGKQVPSYIPEWGIALNPADQAQAYQYHEDVMEPVKENEGILQKYKDDFADALGEYDTKLAKEVEEQKRRAVGGVSDNKRGSGFWRKMKHDRPRYTEAEYERLVGLVEVYKEGGEEALFDAAGIKQSGLRFYKDRRENLLSEVKRFVREVDTDKRLQKTITSGNELRDASIGEYEHNVSEVEDVIEEQRAPWDLWLQNQQKLFKQGVESNTASINGLVESGALQFKGSVKK